jgi:hypothetical protein
MLLLDGACGDAAGMKTLTGFSTVKLGTAGFTSTVTTPLCAVPAGVVTENAYNPGGTAAPTVRLIGTVFSVAPA